MRWRSPSDSEMSGYVYHTTRCVYATWVLTLRGTLTDPVTVSGSADRTEIMYLIEDKQRINRSTHTYTERVRERERDYIHVHIHTHAEHTYGALDGEDHCRWIPQLMLDTA